MQIEKLLNKTATSCKTVFRLPPPPPSISPIKMGRNQCHCTYFRRTKFAGRITGTEDLILCVATQRGQVRRPVENCVGGDFERSCRSSFTRNLFLRLGLATRHFVNRLGQQLRDVLFQLEPVTFMHIDDFHLLAQYVRDGENDAGRRSPRQARKLAGSCEIVRRLLKRHVLAQVSSYFDHGGTTAVERAKAIDCPSSSCWSRKRKRTASSLVISLPNSFTGVFRSASESLSMAFCRFA
jgi:hypothetical protein